MARMPRNNTILGVFEMTDQNCDECVYLGDEDDCEYWGGKIEEIPNCTEKVTGIKEK